LPLIDPMCRVTAGVTEAGEGEVEHPVGLLGGDLLTHPGCGVDDREPRSFAEFIDANRAAFH
jgi:hypothetical protein